MTDDLERLFNNDKRITNLEQDVRLLQEQVISIQRVLVEIGARTLADSIIGDQLFKDLDTRTQRTIRDRIRSAISTLRGRLGEDAIPEDAYNDFCASVRLGLQSIFTSEQIDSLMSVSSAWKKRFGFFG